MTTWDGGEAAPRALITRLQDHPLKQFQLENLPQAAGTVEMLNARIDDLRLQLEVALRT